MSEQDKIRVLLVDDEPLAREGIRLRLDQASDMEVVDEAANGPEAVAALHAQDIDLLFLDVQMPGMDGFDVVAEIGPERMPVVVFVTAFDQHAVRAFEVRAVDYLLKPIDDDRFARALDHARQQLAQERLSRTARQLQHLLADVAAVGRDAAPAAGPTASPPVQAERRWLERLLVRTRQRVAVVPVADVDWIESAGDYVYLHAARQRHLLRKTLSGLEKQLDPRRFQRIHRRAIINLERLLELRPTDHGEYQVHLTGGTVLKLSRGYRDRFQAAVAGLQAMPSASS